MSIQQSIKEHLECISLIHHSDEILDAIKSSITIITEAYKDNQKVLFCGNGGSAADSEHLAGELSGRFRLDRPPLHADALHISGSALTAISNDYSYEEAYARLLQAKAQIGDVLIAISTSGQSQNIINAIQKATELKLKIISISGQYSKEFHKHSNVKIIVPSTNTPIIQEASMLIGHIICEQVEAKLFKL